MISTIFFSHLNIHLKKKKWIDNKIVIQTIFLCINFPLLKNKIKPRYLVSRFPRTTVNFVPKSRDMEKLWKHQTLVQTLPNLSWRELRVVNWAVGILSIGCWPKRCKHFQPSFFSDSGTIIGYFQGNDSHTTLLPP